MRTPILVILITAFMAAPVSAAAPARTRAHAHSLPHRAVVHTRHAAHRARAHLHMRARQIRHAVRH